MSAPLADVPDGMQEVTVSDVWRGWFYYCEVPGSQVGTHAR